MRNFARLQTFWFSAKITNSTISQMPWITASLIGITTAAALVQLAPAQAAVLSNWEFDPTSQELEMVVPGGTTPRYFLAAEPARIVVDLPNTEIGTVALQQTYGGAVREIRIAQFEPGVTRIVLELAPGTILAPQQVELRQVGAAATSEGQPGDRWVLRPLLATDAPVPIASATPAEPTVSATAPEATNASAAPDVLPPLEPGALEIPVELSSSEPTSASDAPATAAPPAELPPADTAIAPDSFPTPTVTLPDADLPVVEASETEASETEVAETEATETEVAETEASETEATETEASETGGVEAAAAETERIEAEAAEVDSEEAAADLDVAAAEIPAEPEREMEAEEPDPQPETEAAQEPELEPEQAAAASEPTPNLAVEEPEPEPIAHVPAPAATQAPTEEEPAMPEVALEPTTSQSITSPPAPRLAIPSEAGAAIDRSAMVSVPPLAAPEQHAPLSSPPASDSPPARLQASPPAQLSPSELATLPSERASVQSPAPAPSTNNLVEFGQPLPESAFSSLPAVSPSVGLPPAITTAPGSVPMATDAADRILLPSGTVLSLRYPGETTIELAAGQSRQEVLVLAEAVRDQAGNVVLPEGTYVIGRFETQENMSQFVAQAVSVQGQNLLVNAQSDNLLETQQGGLLRNSALGVAAGLVLGGLTGVGLIPAIAAGAATGAGSAYLTSPEIATIQPNQVVEVRLVDDLMARSTLVP
ncbi:MAG: hypothetical protein Kow00121_65190 [Elainellaceae cyanobacterium]